MKKGMAMRFMFMPAETILERIMFRGISVAMQVK